MLKPRRRRSLNPFRLPLSILCNLCQLWIALQRLRSAIHQPHENSDRNEKLLHLTNDLTKKPRSPRTFQRIRVFRSQSQKIGPGQITIHGPRLLVSILRRIPTRRSRRVYDPFFWVRFEPPLQINSQKLRAFGLPNMQNETWRLWKL